MFEALINTPLVTVVSNPGSSPLTDQAVYLNGALSAQVVTATQIGSTPIWTVTFTPNATGVWSLKAWAVIHYRVNVVTKSLYDYVKNTEDEALGSWSWDKDTGVLTMLRQDGTALATFNVADGLSLSSRERV